MEAAVGAATTARVVPGTAVTIKPFVNVNCTDEAAVGVLAPMTTTAVVAFATVQDAAATPVLGVAPTLALHKKPGMKLAPITVMVPPTYAEAGAMEAAVGAATIVNGVPSIDVCAPGASIKVSSMDDSPGVVAVWILTLTSSALTYVQVNVTVPELGIGPTLATHVPEMKFVPAMVIVLPL